MSKIVAFETRLRDKLFYISESAFIVQQQTPPLRYDVGAELFIAQGDRQPNLESKS
jgi:hypothetical protein